MTPSYTPSNCFELYDRYRAEMDEQRRTAGPPLWVGLRGERYRITYRPDGWWHIAVTRRREPPPAPPEAAQGREMQP